MKQPSLLSTNHKLEKKVPGWKIAGLQLAPHRLSGSNVCPSASVATTPRNDKFCLRVLGAGKDVSLPYFRNKPEKWGGCPVADGDTDDLWFLRPEKVHGLRFKGAHKLRTQGCSAYCIHGVANGRFPDVQRARLWRTQQLFQRRGWFLARLCLELDVLLEEANAEGLKLAIRLNVFSDLPWEARPFHYRGESVLTRFPDVQFYDYTKLTKRFERIELSGTEPIPNYRLCFSANWVEER